MSRLPDPPLDPDTGKLIGPPVILSAMAWGAVGRCVMCPEGSYEWWDLSVTGLPPVTDRTGTLTDQVPLHPRCVPELISYWATLLDPEGSGGDVPTETAAGALSSRAVRRPTGAYARRQGVA